MGLFSTMMGMSGASGSASVNSAAPSKETKSNAKEGRRRISMESITGIEVDFLHAESDWQQTVETDIKKLQRYIQTEKPMQMKMVKSHYACDPVRFEHAKKCKPKEPIHASGEIAKLQKKYEIKKK